ncbi:hypothetical protein L208DRAFT_1407848 [Tricholoma matsutake]|nr:hypothetical protein L208DRAFT_1407848 [Tricholoma matsutake 945]
MYLRGSGHESMQQLTLLFTTFAADGTKVTHYLPTERSKDNRKAEEKVQVLEWAHRFASDCATDRST